MSIDSHGGGEGNRSNRPVLRWGWIIASGCVAVVVVAMLVPRRFLLRQATAAIATSTSSRGHDANARPVTPGAKTVATPEEIVAGKVDQFARDRLRIARAMAKRLNVDLPPEAEQFFRAVAAGHWDELNDLFKELRQLRDAPGGDRLRSLWGPILETLLIAECAHAWPAQKLLDYGQATLGSLPPGVVYVGGTDPGRGIPTLLNETSQGDRHIVITQNGLADGTYLEYVRFLYGDQMAMLTEEESQRAFQEYLADAQKRLQHDQQFPDEPKQVQPGEDIQFRDGEETNGGSGTNRTVVVSGQVAVMAINERLLQAIMDKNPGLSFAIEESFPLRSTYSTAVPLGPIMQLRAPDAQDSFNSDAAAQTLNYWRSTAQQLSTDADAPEGSDVRKTYSHMADAQANLLADHNFNTEAEQTYRLAMQMEPDSPEAVNSLANLLIKTGRADEARQLFDAFNRNHPGQALTPVPWVLIHSQPPPK